MDGESSQLVYVASGVPQGMVLGPILFLCHINDLPERVRSQVWLLADDCLLYREIKSQQDHTILQNDLIELEKWAKLWGMRFNAKKCYILSVRARSSHFYDLCGQTLKQVHQNPYLGVLLSEDMKWAPHISQISGKASLTLGLLRRNLKACPQNCKKLAYVSLVRSTLEYASSVWDPYYTKDIEKLEQIQRKVVRFIIGDYESRQEGFITSKMKELNLLPLQERRKIIRLTLLFKVVNGQVPAINPDDYIQLDTSRRRRAKPTALKDYVTLKSADKSARKNSRCFKLQIGRTEQFNNRLEQSE